jgi:hypothetical protein
MEERVTLTARELSAAELAEEQTRP